MQICKTIFANQLSVDDNIACLKARKEETVVVTRVALSIDSKQAWTSTNMSFFITGTGPSNKNLPLLHQYTVF